MCGDDADDRDMCVCVILLFDVRGLFNLRYGFRSQSLSLSLAPSASTFVHHKSIYIKKQQLRKPCAQCAQHNRLMRQLPGQELRSTGMFLCRRVPFA